ncbi:MAG: DUF3592 domain-containing protein [Pseudomonadota bacterium]
MTATRSGNVRTDRTREKGSWSVVVSLAILAAVLAAGGGWLRYREHLDASRMAEVQGRVVSLDMKCSRNRRGSSFHGARCRFFPFVVFHARNGRNATFRSNVGASSDYFAIGQSVPVLYDPGSNAPEDTAYIRDYGISVSSFVWQLATAIALAALLIPTLPALFRSRVSRHERGAKSQQRRSPRRPSAP